MSCDELRDQYELYVLGVLEPPERVEIEEHLHREGDPCITGVRRARELMGSLALVAPESQPPARLRRKVGALVGEQKRPLFRAPEWIGATVAMAIIAGWLANARREQARTLADARLEVQRKSTELVRLNEAFALMNDPAAKQLVFGEAAPTPRGRVFVNS